MDWTITTIIIVIILLFLFFKVVKKTAKIVFKAGIIFLIFLLAFYTYDHFWKSAPAEKEVETPLPQPPESLENVPNVTEEGTTTPENMSQVEGG